MWYFSSKVQLPNDVLYVIHSFQGGGFFFFVLLCDHWPIGKSRKELSENLKY